MRKDGAKKENMIVCPECGIVFNRPRFDIKSDHLGWTLKGWGVLDCPSCGVERPSSEFQEMTDSSA